MKTVAILLSFLLLAFVSRTSNAIDVRCASQLSSIRNCLSSNNCVSRCGSFDVDSNVNNCNQANSAVCAGFSCCSECFNPLESYYECGLATFGIICDFECSSAFRGTAVGSVVLLVVATVGMTFFG